jgi:hypothetical protein
MGLNLSLTTAGRKTDHREQPRSTSDPNHLRPEVRDPRTFQNSIMLKIHGKSFFIHLIWIVSYIFSFQLASNLLTVNLTTFCRPPKSIVERAYPLVSVPARLRWVQL